MTDFVHVRRQHGIGQGGFHSAFIQAEVDNKTFRFDYIYDCGALTNGQISAELERNIRSYRPRREKSGKCVLDALVLSHFDKDHINGAEIISKKFEVTQIFVPYLAPELLVLEVCRQAASLELSNIENLISIANEGLLWGVPVVQILGSSDASNEESTDLPPYSRERNPTEISEGDGTRLFPHPMKASPSNSTTANIPAQLDHTKEVRLSSLGIDFWRLKFWNQNGSIGDLELLALTLLVLLDSVEFPVEAFVQPGGAELIMNWLKENGNRDLAIEAYRMAVENIQGFSLTGKENSDFPNFISLAMFSGPIPETGVTYQNNMTENVMLYPVDFWPISYWSGKPGWLGTGDAMLGEPAIWNNFSKHYFAELNEVGTVLLPHHGAAPITGSRYYNPGLNFNTAVHSVFSFGKANTYGHPSQEVLNEVLIGEGLCVLVNEDTINGFCEVIRDR